MKEKLPHLVGTGPTWIDEQCDRRDGDHDHMMVNVQETDLRLFFTQHKHKRLNQINVFAVKQHKMGTFRYVSAFDATQKISRLFDDTFITLSENQNPSILV